MSRIAIVTGSESGIGAAIADLLRGKGWSVMGMDLSPTADHVADVSDPDVVRRTDLVRDSVRGDHTFDRVRRPRMDQGRPRRTSHRPRSARLPGMVGAVRIRARSIR